MKYQTNISEDYLNSVDGVKAWIVDYCKRNGITIEREEIQGKFVGETDGYNIVLIFKSNNQLMWFARKGNQRFPYFEFI
jgi:hypothetical protein